MSCFKKNNKNHPIGDAKINGLDKAKLIEVINDININDEAKERIMAACAEKIDSMNSKEKSVFFKFKTISRDWKVALPLLATVLIFSIVGFNLLPGIWTGPHTGSSSYLSESPNISTNFSGTSQTINSSQLDPIVVTVPKWFSPGELTANQFYQNFLPGTNFEQTLSSQYVYVNAQKDAIFKTGEHKNCRNFRFNIKSGKIECIDHFIRQVLIPANIMTQTDRIYFNDCAPSDEFALIDIRNSKDAYKSTYRFNLQTGDLIKINENLNQVENWRIFKDYSTIITNEYTSVWKIYLLDIVSGSKKNIVSEKNATNMFDLSPGNQYIWYSLLKNGNKNLRCIYQISTGTKTFITSESYPFFTPDDKFVLYFAGNKIYRQNLESKEDVVLVENASWKTQGLITIAAYDEAAGRMILSAFGDTHYDLYSLDIRTGKMVHIVDPENGVQITAPNADSYENTKESYSNSNSKESYSSSNSKESYSSNNSYIVSSEYYKSSEYMSSQDYPKDKPKPTQSISEGLPQPVPVVARGANVYLFDKTGKYIFYYTDLHGKGGNIYCYDISSGEQFAVALPEGFVKKLMADRYNLMYPDKPFAAQYSLYLSDDSTHIYLTYEIYRTIYSDSLPLSKLVEYAKQYNTIIHFGKYLKNPYYQSELPGRSYSVYTDDGKVAILNENYTTRKFALILFDKPFDTSKPYGGGEILIQKDIPADADWFLADWWNQNYEHATKVYSMEKVLDFVKTHDSLNGFTKIYNVYSLGRSNEGEKEIAIFYQICVGPNKYVNVTENYAEMKLQIINANTGATIFEKALNPAIKNSDHLPKY